MKFLSVYIPDKTLKEFLCYLDEFHLDDNCVLGLTLSFGSFSCEVRVNSRYLYSLGDEV